jgi:hypothetical protein
VRGQSSEGGSLVLLDKLGGVDVERLVGVEGQKNVGSVGVHLIHQVSAAKVVKQRGLVEVHESAFESQPDETEERRTIQLSSTGFASSSSAG